MKTPLTDLIGIRHPIVQTGMGWISDSRMTAATAEAGGLGILAAATLNPSDTAASIRQIKEVTDAPFGVNFLSAQAGVDEIIETIISEGVRVASFSRGPQEATFRRLNDAGVIVIPTIGKPRHAEKVVGWGADAVIVQGAEGGGHTGAISTSLLIPAVVDAVDVPVIAAGGFSDGRGLAAALALGAAGIAMGTRFLLTEESPAPDHVKDLYLASNLDATVVTTRVDGLPNRVLNSEAVQRLEHDGWIKRFLGALRSSLALRPKLGLGYREYISAGLAMKKAEGLSWTQALLAAHAADVYRVGVLEGDLESGVLSSGQVTGTIEDIPSIAALIERVIGEAEETLDRIASLR